MKRKKKQRASSLPAYFIIFLLILGVGSGLAANVLFNLPAAEIISSYLPNETTKIYSADGQVLADLYQEENRIIVPLNFISDPLKMAIVAAEDIRFYKHYGIDPHSILRAFFSNLVHLKIVEGGSTITQQLARNVFLTRRKTITRKLAEIVLALQIERRYTKEEILEFYLNQIYWGHNTYGIESAALLYFNKSSSLLNLGEAAMLAGIVRGPEFYSPYKNFPGAKARQKMVLDRLKKARLISKNEYEKALNDALKLGEKKRTKYRAPYFCNLILQHLISKYGAAALYTGGMKVYTTLDMKMQALAEDIVEQMINYGRKFRISQGALVAIDPANGYIKAMVGGEDFNKSEFNRAVHALRQPGSAFKPFVYLTAIINGRKPTDLIIDAPISYDTPQGLWEVQNYDRKFKGPTTLRRGLELSRNVVTVKLLDQIGVEKVVETAKKMGLKSNIEPNLSLALGTSEVSLLDITSAYGVLSNKGVRAEPLAILKVEDRYGSILEENKSREEKVLDEDKVAIIVDMMRGVILRGTGRAANIGRPAAGKTGTTEEYRDAWFIGFVPQLACGIWAGNDDNAPTAKVTGGMIPALYWRKFMSQVLKDIPIASFSEIKKEESDRQTQDLKDSKEKEEIEEEQPLELPSGENNQ